MRVPGACTSVSPLRSDSSLGDASAMVSSAAAWDDCRWLGWGSESLLQSSKPVFRKRVVQARGGGWRRDQTAWGTAVAAACAAAAGRRDARGVGGTGSS